MNLEEQQRLQQLATQLHSLRDRLNIVDPSNRTVGPGLDLLHQDLLGFCNNNKEATLLSKWSEPQKVGTDGFVRLVEVMGGDHSIVQAARVSYGKGTKQVSEDRGLIRYLMRHHHTTPLEMCEIKLHIRLPMDVMRQWIRHRTANVNEYSTRYSEAIDSQNTTTVDEWRLQSSSNKQGSSGLARDLGIIEIDGQDYDGPGFAQLLTEMESNVINTTKIFYDTALAGGIAREQARKNLTLNTYTEAYWKIDLHNLFHFLRLRLHLHAQQEIREFGEAIANIVRDWVPISYEAFFDYRLNAKAMSAQEMNVIRAIANNYLGGVTIFDLTPEQRVEFFTKHGLTNKRERQELWTKLKSS